MDLYIIVPIVAIFVIAQTIAYKKDSKLTDTLGVTCCGFILVLYVLSFLGILSWIDAISVPILIGVIVWLMYNEELKICFQKFLTIQNVIIILFMIFIVVCQAKRLVLWSEDVYFWNIDLKQLWSLNGMASKYGYAAPDFGDYPPAVNLFKWFFVHMNQTKYIEGLGLAGYTCLNFILLLPLSSRVNELVERKIVLTKERKSKINVATNKKYVVSDKRLISKYKVNFTEGSTGEEEHIDASGVILLIFINIFACFVMLLLPTIVNKICFEGTSADVTMGIIYGMLLWSIWDKRMDRGKYYYVRIAIYGAALALCKIIGICWALMALVFLIGCYIGDRVNLSFDSATEESKIKYIIGVVVCWFVAFGSWIVFCVYNHRISAITRDGIALMQSKDFDVQFFLKANSFPFLQGFTVYPMHTNTSGLLDLSVLMIFAVFVGAIIAYAKMLLISKYECIGVLAYTVFSGLIAYGVIFVGHLTIFAGEARYSTGQGMAVSLSMYSAPYVLGMFILVCGMWFDTIPAMKELRPTTEFAVKEHIQAERLRNLRIFYVAIAGFVLLSCDYVVVFNALTSYSTNFAEEESKHDYRIDANVKTFLSEIEGKQELVGKRVLYIRDTDFDGEEANPYISLEASPVAVVFGRLNDGANINEIWEYINHSHADFVYVDTTDDTIKFFNEACEDGYREHSLYRIIEDDRLESYHATLQLEYNVTDFNQ